MFSLMLSHKEGDKCLSLPRLNMVLNLSLFLGDKVSAPFFCLPSVWGPGLRATECEMPRLPGVSGEGCGTHLQHRWANLFLQSSLLR